MHCGVRCCVSYYSHLLCHALRCSTNLICFCENGICFCSRSRTIASLMLKIILSLRISFGVIVSKSHPSASLRRTVLYCSYRALRVLVVFCWTCSVRTVHSSLAGSSQQTFVAQFWFADDLLPGPRRWKSNRRLVLLASSPVTASKVATCTGSAFLLPPCTCWGNTDW